MDIKATREFSDWLKNLKDVSAQVRIQTRIDRLAMGNPGDHRNLKGSVSELRMRFGPAYRVYYTQRSDTLIILLCGGDKSSQSKDIRRAQALANQL